MTRKDFANLAQTLGYGCLQAGVTDSQRDAIVREVARALGASNPAFRRSTFDDAVKLAAAGGHVAYATV